MRVDRKVSISVIIGIVVVVIIIPTMVIFIGAIILICFWFKKSIHKLSNFSRIIIYARPTPHLSQEESQNENNGNQQATGNRENAATNGGSVSILIDRTGMQPPQVRSSQRGTEDNESAPLLSNDQPHASEGHSSEVPPHLSLPVLAQNFRAENEATVDAGANSAAVLAAPQIPPSAAQSTGSQDLELSLSTITHMDYLFRQGGTQSSESGTLLFAPADQQQQSLL